MFQSCACVNERDVPNHEMLGDFLFARISRNPPHRLYTFCSQQPFTLPNQIFNDSQNQPNQRALCSKPGAIDMFSPERPTFKSFPSPKGIIKMRMTFPNLLWLKNKVRDKRFTCFPGKGCKWICDSN